MKTIKRVTRLFGVDDVRLFPITEDTEFTYKCGDGIELPGVRQISITYEIEENLLAANKNPLDVSNKIKSVSYEMEYAKLAQSDIKKLQNQPLQLKGQILDIVDGGGDVHFCLYKANAKINPVGGKDDCIDCHIEGKGEYTKHKFKNTTKLMDIEIHSSVKKLEAIEDIAKPREELMALDSFYDKFEYLKSYQKSLEQENEAEWKYE